MPGLSARRAVAALAIVLLAAGCESAAEKVARHQARGLELVAAGEYEKARLEFSNAVRIDRNFVPAIVELARLRERAGDLQGMVGFLNRVIDLDPAHLWARTRLAQVMLAMGAFEPALAHAEAAVKAAPADPEALATRALVRLRLGNPAGAEADARAALEAGPEHLPSAMALASILAETGRTEQALAFLEPFAAAQPENLPLSGLRLRLFEALDRQEAIGAELARIVALHPGLPGLRAALAEWHLGRGDPAAAKEQYRAIVAAMPGDAGAALAWIGFLDRTEGQAAARAELERLAAAPEAPFALTLALARYEDFTGAKAEARARLAAVAAAAERPAADVAAARLLLAEFLVADGDRAGARAELDRIIAGDPGNSAALALRARTRLAEGDAAAALADLRRALNENPRNPEVLGLIAEAHLATGNRVLAGENLAAAMQASDFGPPETIAYAGFLIGEGRPAPAESVLSEAVRRNPGSRELMGELAAVRLRLGDWVGAETMAKALRELDAGDALADRILAAAESGQSRYEESLRILEGLAGRSGERDAAMAALVSTYVRAGRPEKAEEFLAGVLADDPANLEALYLRAALREETGDMAAAEAAHATLVAAAPDNPRSHEALAGFHLRRERADLAEAALRAGLARLPEAPTLRMLLAGLLEREGRYDEAIAEYEILHAAEPQSIIVLNNLVSLVTDHYPEDRARIAGVLEKAKALAASDIPEIRDTYGWALFLAGDAEAALRSLIPAAEALPDNPWVRLHAGLALARLGRAAEARVHLEAVLRLTEGTGFPRRAAAEAALAGLGG